MIRGFDNDSGSADGLVTMVICFVLAGAFFVFGGYGIDVVTMLINNGSLATTGEMQMKYDVINLMIMEYRVLPLIVLVGLGVYNWAASTREYSAVSSLRNMVLACAGTPLSLMFMIVIAASAGKALDMLQGIGASLNMGCTTTGLCNAVSWIPNMVYGLIMLVSFGIVIALVLNCVSEIDYQSWVG